MRKSRKIFAPYSLSRRRQRRKTVALVAGVGLCALLVGGTVLANKYSNPLGQLTIWLPFLEHSPISPKDRSNSAVLELVSQPVNERAAQLEAIAKGKRSLERSRARYLLATDLLAQGQGDLALRWLEGLERDYPILADHIALKRAQAYELQGDKTKALAAWQEILKRYGNRPVAAQALYALLSEDSPYKNTAIAQAPNRSSFLGRVQHFYAISPDNPRHWERAIAKYPSHPLILELAQARLEQESNPSTLMVLLANYAFDSPNITSVLDQLVGNYSQVTRGNNEPVIQPEDWQAIALGYWRDRKYGQASAAYAKAEPTSRHAYLSALGLEYAQKTEAAKRAYKQMVRDFPDAKETPAALLHLAKLQPDIEAVPYLDQVINQFPDRAGEALLIKAETLDRLQSHPAAANARQVLVTQYGNSDAAATYRWQVAQEKATTGDLEAAWQWANQITTETPHTFLAREAGFWAGKWAKKLGHQQKAKAAFEQVIANHPQSYYAWRSAVQLGWDVGDFTTVRQMNPQVVLPQIRPVLPVGSETLKELYQLGQDEDAWMLWQAEFTNRMQPTVAEQFTDGLIRFAVGDHLAGISQISSLEDRETPEEQAEYQELQEQLTYWQALYPFPFLEKIETYSQKHNLNPLLVTALIRQESRFEPEIRSGAGAVGLMQVMPVMGDRVAEQINLENYSLENPEDNIKLGTWLLHQIHQNHQNNSLLAVASYNAGEGNTTRWLRQKGASDPDEFVEAIPFNETRDYVKQVFSNYWNYLRLYDPQVAQQLAKYTDAQPTAMLDNSPPARSGRSF